MQVVLQACLRMAGTCSVKKGTLKWRDVWTWLWLVGNYGALIMFWDQECCYDRLVFKIDHMRDRVYVWYIINLTQHGRWRGANQKKIKKRLYRNHTTHWVLNSYVRSVTGVTIASFKLAILLYAQSYNLTWVLVAFLVGSVLVSGGVVMWRRGKRLSLSQVACFVGLGCVARLRLLWPPAT